MKKRRSQNKTWYSRVYIFMKGSLEEKKDEERSVREKDCNNQSYS